MRRGVGREKRRKQPHGKGLISSSSPDPAPPLEAEAEAGIRICPRQGADGFGLQFRDGGGGLRHVADQNLPIFHWQEPFFGAFKMKYFILSLAY